jgi:hypothetical protein
MVGSPRQQPRFHVLMFDVMSGFLLAISLTYFGQHSFLVGNI